MSKSPLALVSGGGGGLGLASAKALAARGYDLVLIGRTQAKLEGAAEELSTQGVNVEVVAADVTDKTAIATAVAGLGAIDVLVNAAGTNVPEPFLDVTVDTLNLLMQANIAGTVYPTQAVVRNMTEHGTAGAVVNISSQMGHVGAANRTIYCATKHAIEGLTKALAVELAPRGIRVNAVAPTYIVTPMTKPFFEDQEFLEDSLRRIPLGRLGAPEDVGEAVAYLASPQAGMVTGTSLVVDGGYTAQ